MHSTRIERASGSSSPAAWNASVLYELASMSDARGTVVVEASRLRPAES